jgi:hypothetical protein
MMRVWIFSIMRWSSRCPNLVVVGKLEAKSVAPVGRLAIASNSFDSQRACPVGSAR